jgi:hypothetical protein
MPSIDSLVMHMRVISKCILCPLSLLANSIANNGRIGSSKKLEHPFGNRLFLLSRENITGLYMPVSIDESITGLLIVFTPGLLIMRYFKYEKSFVKLDD